MANSYGLVVPTPKKGGRGRPTKYLQATVDELLGLLELGISDSLACKRVGITTKGFRAWRIKFPDFNAAVLFVTGPSPPPIEKKQASQKPIKFAQGNKYGLTVQKPRAKKTGRPSKYAQPLVDKILRTLEVGAPEVVACAEVGINTDTMAEWKNRYPEFSEAVHSAKASAHLSVIVAVKRSVHGYPCKRCNKRGSEWKVDRDGNDFERKCPACQGTGFAVKPDGKLGLTLLERRLPGEYGRHNTTDVRVTGGVVVAHVAAEVKLDQLTAEQLAALAWDDEPLLLEAEE